MNPTLKAVTTPCNCPSFQSGSVGRYICQCGHIFDAHVQNGSSERAIAGKCENEAYQRRWAEANASMPDPEDEGTWCLNEATILALLSPSEGIDQ